MNVEQRQAAADPPTKPPGLGCESARRLLSYNNTTLLRLSVYDCLLVMKDQYVDFVLNFGICVRIS